MICSRGSPRVRLKKAASLLFKKGKVKLGPYSRTLMKLISENSNPYAKESIIVPYQFQFTDMAYRKKMNLDASLIKRKANKHYFEKETKEKAVGRIPLPGSII